MAVLCCQHFPHLDQKAMGSYPRQGVRCYEFTYMYIEMLLLWLNIPCYWDFEKN
jgi:hypothetical protein